MPNASEHCPVNGICLQALGQDGLRRQRPKPDIAYIETGIAEMPRRHRAA
jgi:hypothetical protein